MSYLRCNARACTNNQRELCIREGIRVDGDDARQRKDTCCGSFTLRPETYSNVVERNCAAQPETDIACDAMTCSYNQDCKCTAPSVDISGSGASDSSQTQCSTFDRKK